MHSRPWLLLSGANGKKCMPSWCMPICTACSAAVFDASGLNAGMLPGMPTGSPHAAIGCATYPSGTMSLSVESGAMPLKPSIGPIAPDPWVGRCRSCRRRSPPREDRTARQCRTERAAQHEATLPDR
jgi:hypothetical protein